MSDEMTNDELSLLLNNIRQEIDNNYRSGIDKATVRLEPREVPELEHIKRNLEVEGRTFHFDEASSRLTIDSSKCPKSLD
ncbi:hypothetical protein JFT37_19405 [Pseudomonas fluorescens]|nr:hypothetical protein [Pseudomonas fluorescens]